MPLSLHFKSNEIQDLEKLCLNTLKVYGSFTAEEMYMWVTLIFILYLYFNKNIIDKCNKYL